MSFNWVPNFVNNWKVYHFCLFFRYKKMKNQDEEERGGGNNNQTWDKATAKTQCYNPTLPEITGQVEKLKQGNHSMISSTIMSLTVAVNPVRISFAPSGSLVTGDYLCQWSLGLRRPTAAEDWRETGDEVKTRLTSYSLSSGQKVMSSGFFTETYVVVFWSHQLRCLTPQCLMVNEQNNGRGGERSGRGLASRLGEANGSSSCFWLEVLPLERIRDLAWFVSANNQKKCEKFFW